MRLRGAAFFFLLLAAGSIGQGCGGSATPEPEAPPPANYEVRGVVRQIREVAEGKTQLSILHEAIPDFVGIKGDVVGMKSMTMPFTVAESVDLTGIEPGARVRFELSVDWDRTDPALITSLGLLPPNTVLGFESSE